MGRDRRSGERGRASKEFLSRKAGVLDGSPSLLQPPGHVCDAARTTDPTSAVIAPLQTPLQPQRSLAVPPIL